MMLFIDEVWLEPDIYIEFDQELYQRTGVDNQLEQAKYLWSLQVNQ